MFIHKCDKQSTFLQVGTSHASRYKRTTRLQMFTNFCFKLGITKFPSPSCKSDCSCHGWRQVERPDRLTVPPAQRFLSSSGLTLIFCSKRRTARKQRASPQTSTPCRRPIDGGVTTWHSSSGGALDENEKASLSCENHHQSKQEPQPLLRNILQV